MSSGKMQPVTGHPFGIDFGGTGIKGAPVDLDQGDFAQERVRIKTPTPSTPDAVAERLDALMATLEPALI